MYIYLRTPTMKTTYFKGIFPYKYNEREVSLGSPRSRSIAAGPERGHLVRVPFSLVERLKDHVLIFT